MNISNFKFSVNSDNRTKTFVTLFTNVNQNPDNMRVTKQYRQVFVYNPNTNQTKIKFKLVQFQRITNPNNPD